MSNKIIGKCSLCNGNVVIPELWFGVQPPIATCQTCGGVEKNKLPVIDMIKPNQEDFSKKQSNLFEDLNFDKRTFEKYAKDLNKYKDVLNDIFKALNK